MNWTAHGEGVFTYKNPAFCPEGLKKGKTVRMAGFRAQIPTGDTPHNKLNAHRVTDYCYVFQAYDSNGYLTSFRKYYLDNKTPA